MGNTCCAKEENPNSAENVLIPDDRKAALRQAANTQETPVPTQQTPDFNRSKITDPSFQQSGWAQASQHPVEVKPADSNRPVASTQLADSFRPMNPEPEPFKPIDEKRAEPVKPVEEKKVEIKAEPKSSVLEASVVEDLHLDAKNVEITKKMNSLHFNVEKKLSGMKEMASYNYPEEHRVYSAHHQIEQGSVLRDKTSGSTYQGQMHRGVAHGFGRLVHVDGSVTEGFFKEGKPHGTVRRVLVNGTVFEGQFSNNAANGKGVQIDPNGVITSCDTWLNGEPDGKVIIKNPSGVTLFEGVIKKGKRNGEGMLYDEKLKIRSSGRFIDDYLDGKGKKVYDNGVVYEGDFSKGTESGLGTITFIDGRKFTGPFVNGKPHGEGTLYTDSGKPVKTTWKDGKRI